MIRAQARALSPAWPWLVMLPLIALLLASCAQAPRQALTAVEAQDIAECRLIEALDGDSGSDEDGDSFHRCLASKGY